MGDDPKVLESRLSAIKDKLAAALRKCRAELNHILPTAGARDANDGHYDKVLLTMGLALFEAAKEAWSTSEDDEVEFYFWPGYFTILGPEVGRRISLRDENGSACGVGYSRKRRSQVEAEYRGCLASISYNEILQPRTPPDILLGRDFTPGGTHGWLVHGDVLLQDGAMLELLEIFTDSCAPEADSHRPWRVSIPLPPESPDSWGATVAHVLNDPSRTKSLNAPLNLWPLPFAPNSPIPRSDKQTQSRDSHQWSVLAQRCREALYSIWLAVLFDPGWHVHLEFDPLGDILGDDRKSLGDLHRRVTWLRDLAQTEPHHHYRYWYTLDLESTIGPEGLPSEVGTIMLLTSHRLPSWYFEVVKTWCEIIYLNIRYLESGIRLIQRGEERGEQQQANLFAHQTAGLVALVWLDQHLQALGARAQYALWMIKTLITRVWGKVPFNPLAKPDDIPGQKDASATSMLDWILECAILQGLLRAADLPSSDTPEFGAFMQEVCPLAVELLERADGIDEVKRRLGISIPEDPPPWVNTIGFTIAFHHAAWQAVRHGLIASVLEKKDGRPCVQLKTDDRQFTLGNRSRGV
jgi:hypothetical protein